VDLQSLATRGDVVCLSMKITHDRASRGKGVCCKPQCADVGPTDFASGLIDRLLGQSVFKIAGS
jgi:hypothetical protein